ncbi:hypothetical protein LguiA_007612 [Lonicera macranthoides]
METTTIETVEAEEKSMAYLPVDVLSLIGSRLLARDLIYFRSVCRAWRSVISPLPSSSVHFTKSITSSVSALVQFPLLMYSGCESSFYSFYHPICNTTYVLESPEIANAKIRFSKDGWLLMSGSHEIFFFNPFTKKRIDLPNLPDGIYNCRSISFSSIPTLADCIVFGIMQSFLDYILFSFIRRGEDTWNTFRSTGNLDFWVSHNNPVFHNGVFYCLGKNGNLGTFDPQKAGEGEDEDEGAHGWTVLAKPMEKPCNSIRQNYLVECNGDLIAVFVGHVGKWIKIFKLDSCMMVWRKVESLGDQNLFLSRSKSLSATKQQEVLGMENKIFFPRFHRKNGIFYSLNTGRFHTMGTGYNSNDFYNTTTKMHCTWIQPSSQVSFDEEFHWW